MATLPSLTDLKLWCRVSHDDEDALITDLGTAATAFVEQATGRAFADMDGRAAVAAKMLTAHWFEHREAVTIGTAAEVPLTVSRLVHHLRDWSEPADEVEE